VCGFNFEETWGELGKDFIHVHHLKEISSVGEEYEVDPINDLIPVCPNCHAMLHHRRPALSVGELQSYLSRPRFGSALPS
jgi:5-methylcytosine-specific restriction enzyme A